MAKEVFQDPVAGTIHNETEMSCDLFGGDRMKCERILIVRKTVTALSLSGCLLMISIIILFRLYKIFVQRLIVYMTLGDILKSIGHAMTNYPPDASCQVEAFIMTFGLWAVMLWICCITFNIYKGVIAENRMDKYERLYHVLCWGVTFVISVAPFVGKRYGPAGLWCWVMAEETTTGWSGWQMGIWYIPCFVILAVLFLANIYIWYKMIRKIRTWQGHFNPDEMRRKVLMRETVKPLKLYPICYLVVSVTPLIHRVAYAFYPQWNFTLMLLHTIFSPLHGLLNTLVFLFDKEINCRLTRVQIKLALHNWFCNKGQDHIEEYPIVPYHNNVPDDVEHLGDELETVCLHTKELREIQPPESATGYM